MADIAEMCFGMQRGQPGFIGQRILRIGGVPDHRAAGFQDGYHIEELVLDCLETADDAIELRALLHEGEGVIEHVLCGAEACRLPARARPGIQNTLHCSYRRIGGVQQDRVGIVEMRRSVTGRVRSRLRCMFIDTLHRISRANSSLAIGRKNTSRWVGAPASISAGNARNACRPLTAWR